MRLDQITVEVISVLRANAIESILLKGPTMAQWLYDHGERSYVDVDLLVPLEEYGRVGSVLTECGFVAPPEDLSLNRPRASREWIRATDDTVVDAHLWLEGIGIQPANVWEILAEGSEYMMVSGQQVAVLAPPARSLHVALHAAQNGRSGTQALKDLERAIDKVAIETWREAAELAITLDALPAFTTGLSLDPRGPDLLRRLSIELVHSVDVAVISAAVPHQVRSTALGWEWLSSRSTVRGKAGYIFQKLFPPPTWMKARYPAGQRGGVGLMMSYPQRWLKLARHLIPGLVTWMRARSRI